MSAFATNNYIMILHLPGRASPPAAHGKEGPEDRGWLKELSRSRKDFSLRLFLLDSMKGLRHEMTTAAFFVSDLLNEKGDCTVGSRKITSP